MKCLPVRIALVVTLVLVAKLAAAGGVVGRWIVDEDAMRERLSGLVERELAGLDANQRRMVAPMIAARVDEMLAQIRGTAEFLPDGTAIFTDPSGGRDTGRWEERDGRILLEADGRDAPMTGRFEGDRLVFRAPPEAGAGPGFALVLRRDG